MYKKPTSRFRHLILDIETVSSKPEDPKGALSALTGRVVCICMLVDDGERLTEHKFAAANEADLLNSFWENVLPNDLFVGHNALEFDLTFIRQRSYVNAVRASREIDLRRFYSHDVVDTMASAKHPGVSDRRRIAESVQGDDPANEFHRLASTGQG